MAQRDVLILQCMLLALGQVLHLQGACWVQVSLAGVLRRSEKPSMFVPENDAARNAWYWLDVPALAKACGLPPDTPLLEVPASICPQFLRNNSPHYLSEKALPKQVSRYRFACKL